MTALSISVGISLDHIVVIKYGEVDITEMDAMNRLTKKDTKGGGIIIRGGAVMAITDGMRSALNYIEKLVGARGFEPPTTCTPCMCATRLRYAPTLGREPS